MTPMTTRVEDAVFVEAPARLHFGVLDLRGTMGRWFGGIGAAAPAPTLLVSASASDTVTVEGEDADRAAQFARRMLAHVRQVRGAARGARIRVHRALPPHAGLGSGTQLALAIGRALSELHGVDVDAAELARTMGRAKRSAIGTWTFAGGGLIVEGGRRVGQNDVAPLLARLPFPASWRCVLAVPHARAGVSGAAESRAFAELPSPPQVERCHDPEEPGRREPERQTGEERGELRVDPIRLEAALDDGGHRTEVARDPDAGDVRVTALRARLGVLAGGSELDSELHREIRPSVCRARDEEGFRGQRRAKRCHARDGSPSPARGAAGRRHLGGRARRPAGRRFQLEPTAGRAGPHVQLVHRPEVEQRRRRRLHGIPGR